MRAFPDVQALARAPEEQLLKLWEGLGYYSRARNLQKAARQICDLYGGEFPETAEELERLPGIGAYTAGAIASIACGKPEPAVDGNVLRVLARFDASNADVTAPAVRKRTTEKLRAVYPSGAAAGALTEGLMELGETVCLPNAAPRCAVCPLAGLCAAHARKRETDFPVRGAKKERRIEQKTVLLLQCGDLTALKKRPDTGLLARMWGFPMADGAWDQDTVLARFPGADIVPLGEAVHLFTHVEWHMVGWRVRLNAPTDGFLWASREEILQRYAVPTAFKPYLRQL